MILWVVGAVLWYLSGTASFVFWWTKTYDFEAGELFVAAFAGVVGPIAFLVGWSIHGERQRVLVRKRAGQR